MRKAIYTIFAIFLLSFSFKSIASAEISDIRVSGESRFETAVEISKAAFTESETVILSTAYNFPDALAGGSLAYKEDAPILLSAKDSLGKATKEEILRLQAKKAIILGSEGVVSEKVVKELNYIGVSVERIGGKDRFTTATMVAQKLDNPNTAIIAYGRNFPDALAVAPYAAKNGFPILLVEKDEIPKSTKEYLKNIENTIVVGGTSIISPKVMSELPDPERIYGVDRFQTNAKIIEKLQMDSFSSYISTGYNFADALTGSVLAAKNNAAMLLVKSNELPAPIHYVLNEKKFSEAIPLGGRAVVTDSVVQEITDLILNNSMETALPISADNTYTSHLISSKDADYYKLNVEKPGKMSFSMARNKTSDWYLHVYNSEGERLGYTEIDTGDGVHTFNLGLSKGMYYLKFEDSTGYNDYSNISERYTFDIDFDSVNTFEQEVNDSLSQATVIKTDTLVEGQLNLKSNSDIDYYKFNLSSPGKVELEFNQNKTSDWFVTVYDTKGNEIGYKEIESGSGAYHLDFGLNTGDHYIKVTDDTGYDDYDDSNDTYTFKLNYEKSDRFEKEINGTMETASTVKMDGNDYTGTIQGHTSKSDNDYYEFVLPEAGNVNVDFSRSGNADWNVYFYNSDGIEVGFYELESGTDSRYLMMGMPAGTLYMRVTDDTGYDDTEDYYEPYTFSATYEKSAFFEKEINNKHYQSTPLVFNQEYKGAIQSYTHSSADVDYYKLDVPANGTITIKMNREEYDDFKYTLYNEDLSRVTYGSVESGFSQYSREIVLEKGTYYLALADETGYDDYYDSFETYTFQVDFAQY
ncbi:cell wall-binding repeat-containing protein [Rossellomorea aquimaris]|uniref:Cell wall-binding repeat-containing protein n=1 Tax=Rossellomorea aquimaris TaxID=189382 RepID=A0A5D4TLK1_9BACI|nr:cell wall-binding repeat-containing protein [Rossellomorea aquimaris]TYS75809.1 cell wall-binding repeat-containing protein [Rossellomorea aquimaris]